MSIGTILRAILSTSKKEMHYSAYAMSAGTRPDHPPNGILSMVATRVRDARHQLGLTQGELAKRSHVSVRFLGQLEAGEGNISLERLDDVARALGMTVTALLGAEAPAQHTDSEKLYERVRMLIDRHGTQAVLRWLDSMDGVVTSSKDAVRVALLGIRGAGKSSVGERLAKKLRIEFLELDELIEHDAGMPLSTVFELHGESWYRQRERIALEKLLNSDRSFVLATGGSIVTDQVHFQLLKNGCTTVWLRARPEDHWHRVVEQGDFRPMREHPQAMSELRALFEARKPLYEQAHLVISTVHRDITSVTDELASLIRSKHRDAAE